MSQLIIPGQEQKLDMNITAHRGHLVLQFSRPVEEVVLTLDEAGIFLRGVSEQMNELLKQHGHSGFDINGGGQ